MAIMTKKKAIISLTQNRDMLIRNVQRIENLDQGAVQIYVNGVLDMYNNFVRILKQEPEKDPDLTYED